MTNGDERRWVYASSIGDEVGRAPCAAGDAEEAPTGAANSEAGEPPVREGREEETPPPPF